MQLTVLAGAIVIVVIIAIIVALYKGSDLSAKGIAIAAVGIIVITSALIPAINQLDELPDYAKYDMVYDDYIATDNAVSATDAINLVTIGSTTYLHANSVGSGTVKYEDGTTKTYTVGKAPLDVFLIMGQSNAMYYNADPSAVDPTPTMGTAYYFGSATEPIQYAENAYNCKMYSMNNDDGTVKIGNIEAPLAAKHYQNTGNKVYTINTAVGGQSVTAFQPGEYLYGRASEIFEVGMGAIDLDNYEPHVHSYIWIQGEADEFMDQSEYVDKFLKMNASVCSNEFSGEYAHPIDALIVKVKATRGQNSGPAQEYLAAHYKHIYIATRVADTFSIEQGTLSEDGTHYTQLGDNLIGVDVAEYIYSHKLY